MNFGYQGKGSKIDPKSLSLNYYVNIYPSVVLFYTIMFALFNSCKWLTPSKQFPLILFKVCFIHRIIVFKWCYVSFNKVIFVSGGNSPFFICLIKKENNDRWLKRAVASSKKV